MRVTVVGLGKIGLPLAVQYASAGCHVFGVDIDPLVVSSISEGRVPFPGETELEPLLPALIESGKLVASSNYADAVPDSEVVVIVVPLVVDESGQPDFKALESATQSVGKHLSRNTLVIYETTLPIGTTRQRWKPMLEELSGLVEGRDFHVLFSPERVNSGRILKDLQSYPKLVGALSAEGSRRARAFYNYVIDFLPRPDLPRGNGVWDMGSPEAAEMAKLAETTYRDVNIALANQFALHGQALGLDIAPVIEACNSQPFSHIHQPGVSVGGHCIPVYPQLYLSIGLESALIREARSLNLSMPADAVASLLDALGNLTGRRICVLGVAYRPGVKEHAFSGAYDFLRLLGAEGAEVSFVDPLYSHEELETLGFPPCLDLSVAEVVILHTAHETFGMLDGSDFPSLLAVYDGRDFLDRARWSPAAFIGLGKGEANATLSIQN